MHPRIRQTILAAARATPDVEVCGFVYCDAFGHAQTLPCRNVAADPTSAFEIDVQDHIRALHIGPALLGLYHSHPAGQPATFSRGDPAADTMGDLDWADELALPLYLATPEGGWADYTPTTYQPPLEGRHWCLGFSDCWEVPRLYYRQHHAIHMADYERDESFCHEEQGVILSNYEREGFLQLPPDPSAIRLHDILMFRTDKALPQHFGVFVGQGGYMLHHQNGGLSTRQLLTDRWQERLYCVFRHRSLVV